MKAAIAGVEVLLIFGISGGAEMLSVDFDASGVAGGSSRAAPAAADTIGVVEVGGVITVDVEPNENVPLVAGADVEKGALANMFAGAAVDSDAEGMAKLKDADLSSFLASAGLTLG